MDWIHDYVELPAMSSHKLAERFTLSACEVEDVLESGRVLEETCVATITGIEAHPDADKLQLVSFDAGPAGKGRVVCGAPNCAIGMRVPYAPIGTTLPIGFTLEPKKIRGILSEGMLCAEDELGLSDSHEGLMELESGARIGMTMAEYLDSKPTVVLDIDNKSITHRPDLWGHYGMAREFAAAFKVPLKHPFDTAWQQKMRSRFGKGTSPVSVKVDPDSCCRAYYGYTVNGINVAESPQWMQKRLLDCGLRPINSIVDISNYVMLEMGQPNHIFDRQSIEKGTIIVRRVRNREEFVTLDEQTRHLEAEDTVIADGVKPLVIAGIMGGLNSGVTEKTTEVFVEVANFIDAGVRKSSTRIGLRTDSSLRYEKSLDPMMLEPTALRILELLLELNPGAEIEGNLEYDGINLTEWQAPLIDLKHSKVETLLGCSLERSRVREILESLDFGVRETAEGYAVTVPSFRATKDVECDADLIEEIGRMYGYNSIPAQPPEWKIEAVRLPNPKRLERSIQDFMVLHGNAHEVITYPLIGKALLDKVGWPEKNTELQLANALSKDMGRMRPSLVPGFLEAAADNSRHFNRFAMFEIGRGYSASKEDFSCERNFFAAAFYDRQASRFMDAANTADRLLNFLRLSYRLVDPAVQKGQKGKTANLSNPAIPRDWPGIHPFETLDIQIKGKPAGMITTIHPLTMRAFKAKGYCTLIVLDLSLFEEDSRPDRTVYKPLPRFPHSIFDFTVIAAKENRAAAILKAVESAKLKELAGCRVADVFDIGDGRRAVTVRATFFDPEKTLSGEFLEQAQKKLIDAAEKAGYPLKME
jgi:phenylalanyl-tRNA synthetase beta chain